MSNDKIVSFDVTLEIVANGRHFRKYINARGRTDTVDIFRDILREVEGELKQNKEL